MARKKSKKAPSKPAATQVSGDELRAAFVGPAVRSNKMYLSVTGGGVRLTFMEQHGDAVPPVFRSALFMSFQDASSLRDMLVRQLEGVERGLKEAIEAAESVATERPRLTTSAGKTDEA